MPGFIIIRRINLRFLVESLGEGTTGTDQTLFSGPWGMSVPLERHHLIYNKFTVQRGLKQIFFLLLGLLFLSVESMSV